MNTNMVTGFDMAENVNDKAGEGQQQFSSH
jgi:hypothetical protein